MTIPLEEGFTVVTGPNGSGKSNILDGILFCLGLATSRGMRAERLPDLVNSAVLRAGKAAETVVSVRFDLEGWQPDTVRASCAPRPGQHQPTRPPSTPLVLRCLTDCLACLLRTTHPHLCLS